MEYAPANASSVSSNLSVVLPEADADAASMVTLDGTCTLYDFIIEAVVMGFLCVFGYTGNTLSMICLSRERSKTATPFLLVSLEVADTLFLIAVFFIRTAKSIVRYTDWEAVMPAFPYIAKYMFPAALTAETLTIYLTVLVTVNRYVAVCRPYEVARLSSLQHARRHVLLVAAFCVLYNLPRFFELRIVPRWDPYRNRTVHVAAQTELARNQVYQIVYGNVLYSLVMFVVPLLSLIVLNSRLITALRRTVNKRRQMQAKSAAGAGASHSNRSEEDITLVLIVVVLVFVVCQTPPLVTQLLLVVLPRRAQACPAPFFFYERISDLLVVANSSMNFIIYCFCSRKFRQILINLVCGARNAGGAGDSPPESTKVGGGPAAQGSAVTVLPMQCKGGGGTVVGKEENGAVEDIRDEEDDVEDIDKADGTRESLL